MSVSACSRRPAGGTGRAATFLKTCIRHADGVALHRRHTVAAEAGWLRRARALRCYYVRVTRTTCVTRQMKLPNIKRALHDWHEHDDRKYCYRNKYLVPK